MAFPAFRSAGTLFSSAAADVTPPAPAGLATNDIEFLLIESQAGTHTLTTANGFAQIGTDIDVPNATSTIATHGSLWWRRWNGSAGSPVVAFAGNTNHVQAQRFAFSGCETTGNPWDFVDTSSEAVEDTTGTASSTSSTSGTDRLIAVFLGSAKPDSVTTAEISSPANANLANVTERVDNASNSGNGGHFGLITGEKATAGSVGDTTYTKANAGYKFHFVVALKPPGGGGSPVTISLDVANVSASGNASDIIPGAVTKLLNVATLISTGRIIDTIPGTMNKLLDTALLNASGQSILFDGLNVILFDTALLTANGRALAINKGAVLKSLDTALLISAGANISFNMGDMIIPLDVALINISPDNVVINVGSYSISLDTANASANGRQVSIYIVSGIMLNTAMLDATSYDISLDLGAVIKSLDTSQLISTPYPIDVEPGLLSLLLDASLLTSNANIIDVIAGSYSIPIDTANLFAGDQSVNLLLGPRVVPLDTSLIQSLGNTIIIHIDESIFVLLDTAQLSVNGKNISISVGNVIISLSSATLLSNSPDVIISSILSIVKAWTLSQRNTNLSITNRDNNMTLQNRDTSITLPEDDR